MARETERKRPLHNLRLVLLALMPDCRSIAPSISRELDGPLGLADRLRVRAHVFLCHDCLNYAGNLRFLRSVFRTAPDGVYANPSSEKLSPEARGRIVAAIRERA